MKIEKYGRVVIDEHRITIDGWTIDGDGAVSSLESPLGIEDAVLEWATVQITSRRKPLNHVTSSNNTVLPVPVGDGIADDTYALQSLIDRGLPIPLGTFRITTPLRAEPLPSKEPRALESSGA